MNKNNKINIKTKYLTIEESEYDDDMFFISDRTFNDDSEVEMVVIDAKEGDIEALEDFINQYKSRKKIKISNDKLFKDIPYSKKAVEKMFELINVNMDYVDMTEENWFQNYSWTRNLESKFRIWMVDYLRHNIKARLEIMAFPHTTNRHSIRKVVDMFILNYGWSLKD